MKFRTLLLVTLLAFPAACADHPAAVDDARLPGGGGGTAYRNDAVGVSLALPAGWAVNGDPVLFDDSYGFVVWSEDRDLAGRGPHDREPVARVALVRGATPDRIGDLVRAQMEDNRDLAPRRSEVPVGAGLEGVAVTGLPGTQPYSVVYVATGGRVYEIGLWTAEPGLDDRARALLASLRFNAPTRTLQSLGLRSEMESLHWEPRGEMALESRAALAERKRQAMKDVEAGLIRVGPHAVQAEPEHGHDGIPAASPAPTAQSCHMLAPYGTDMQWQTQWDGTANFYGTKGWTRMSGNGGSWWGEGFHVWQCRTDIHNQYFANDWPLQFGANVYAHFSGYVKYAGWAQGGHYTLGRIVIVRTGKWSSLSAHLNGWGPGISNGVWVDAYWDVIGYAGNSDGGAGYNWDPHLHSRVTHGEFYNGSGMPYGGVAVKPRAFRCFYCTDQDETTSDGRKWYTSFYRDRWMKY